MKNSLLVVVCVFLLFPQASSQELSLPDFSAVKQNVETYLDQLGPYTKNKHTPLSPEFKKMFNERLKDSFNIWGYVLKDSIEEH